MTAWRPLYTRGPIAVVALVMAVVLAAAAVAILVSVLAGEVQPGVVVVCALLALMALFSWRVGRTGVYVSDRGIRVQYLPNSDVVEWADVLRFVVRTARPNRLLAVDAEEIWVVRRSGDPVSTSIGRLVDPPPETWRLAARATHNRDEDFDRALRELEAALARSREAADPPGHR